MYIELDDGYNFGLGFFETIHLYEKTPLFLKEHLNRINLSLDIFKMNAEKINEEEIFDFLNKNNSEKKNEVLKIIVSEKNKIFVKRDYTYTEEKYKKGFSCNIAPIRRNESSIFTFHKSLNYADNIYEKRRSLAKGYDEAIFINSKLFITEGATTNIFFVKDKKIFTPKLECGLLNGIIRKYILRNYEVEEKEIHIDEVQKYDEIFLTNSLLGIMPVRALENYEVKKSELTRDILKNYLKDIKK